MLHDKNEDSYTIDVDSNIPKTRLDRVCLINNEILKPVKITRIG